uniref:NADH-ubiquinone oxidoreductase chain 4 n=1 Tax=Spirobolus grahami TaxID=3065235 RepID=A0AA49K4W7_9MYRI|nr:NADH dehydrogenase subunit 4 [Spirobolus grahami]WKY95841.1 NADH dehydrogenase subunit 4 [Spirobolus grahami]
MLELIGLLVGMVVGGWLELGFTLMIVVFGLVLGSMISLLYINYQVLVMSVFGVGLGGDVMSVGLIWLSMWITVLMLMASLSGGGVDSWFVWLILLLAILLVGVFLSMDLVWFYLMFEGVLVPTLLLLVGYGYQPERLQAGLYLIFYTVFASLPLLLMVLWWESSSCSSSVMCLVNWAERGAGLGFVLYLAGVGAFLVKMPLFLVHLWLPSAHVEAPVSGSMVLAGVLLSMGGFGLIRLCPLFVGWISATSWFWVSLSLWGGVYLSLVCLRQGDVSALIAYSSVVHMGLVVGGIMSLSVIGFMGSYVLMVGHGLCSSGLFCLANVTYDRVGSRSILVTSGFLALVPSGGLVWFLLLSANMAAPPTINLLGEISLLGSLLGWSSLSLVGLGLVSFLSASYSLYLFTSSQHGETMGGVGGFEGFYLSEYLLLLLHWIPLNFIFIKSDLFVL